MKTGKRLLVAAVLAILPHHGLAGERYGQRPPVTLSPDLSAPWVMQLRAPQGRAVQPAVRYQKKKRTLFAAPQRQQAERRTVIIRRQKVEQVRALPAPVTRQKAQRGIVVNRAPVPVSTRKAPPPAMDPRFLPQVVDYSGSEKPGTIVIDTSQRMLYLVQAGGKARRYGVGVGKDGFEWSGTEKISRKREWPDWRPPAEMIAREKKKGRVLPAHMPGGPANPLGARALYLGSTLYRIHGTNAPWTIGRAVSSGCIRMRNEDVTDLYGRVGVGTTVKVL